MAIVHDIAESRTGDVDYLARQYVDRHEDIGIHDMLAETSLEAEFTALWQEYENRTSIESKIVKDADNLDVDMELREQAVNGSSLEKAFDKNRLQVRRTKFYTKTAQAMFDEIKVANPHDWHTKSPRNRLNGGDWKPDNTEKT